jgi:hypothetical protein
MGRERARVCAWLARERATVQEGVGALESASAAATVMSLNHYQGKLWAMKQIASRAEREFAAERAQKKKPAVILKLQSRKPLRKLA